MVLLFSYFMFQQSNKEPADTKWKPASQGRGGRGGGRGNYSSRHVSHGLWIFSSS